MGTVVLVRAGGAGPLQERGPKGQGSWREDEKGRGGGMSAAERKGWLQPHHLLPSAVMLNPRHLRLSHRDAEGLLSSTPDSLLGALKSQDRPPPPAGPQQEIF